MCGPFTRISPVSPAGNTCVPVWMSTISITVSGTGLPAAPGFMPASAVFTLIGAISVMP